MISAAIRWDELKITRPLTEMKIIQGLELQIVRPAATPSIAYTGCEDLAPTVSACGMTLTGSV
jgi:hypothetical protein